MTNRRLILGSQSAQRLRLLESIASQGAVTVLPPISADELGFQSLQTTAEIEERLKLIVQQKTEDVCGQLNQAAPSLNTAIASHTSIPADTVVCADTVVVCADSRSRQVVLGKPPVDQWQDTVRNWFRTYYSDQSHEVWTGFQITVADHTEFQIVKATVEFPFITDDWIDWYLSTEEPQGKAGGYGIQGHAAAFVKSIKGSLTTIIGLPVWELRQALIKHNCL